MRLLSKDPSWITRSARSQSKERAYVVKLGTGVSQWKEPNK